MAIITLLAMQPTGPAPFLEMCVYVLGSHMVFVHDPVVYTSLQVSGSDRHESSHVTGHLRRDGLEEGWTG